MEGVAMAKLTKVNIRTVGLYCCHTYQYSNRWGEGQNESSKDKYSTVDDHRVLSTNPVYDIAFEDTTDTVRLATDIK